MKVTVIMIDDFLRIPDSVKLSRNQDEWCGSTMRDEKGAGHPQHEPDPASLSFITQSLLFLLPQAPPMVLHYRVHGAS